MANCRPATVWVPDTVTVPPVAPAKTAVRPAQLVATLPAWLVQFAVLLSHVPEPPLTALFAVVCPPFQNCRPV